MKTIILIFSSALLSGPIYGDTGKVKEDETIQKYKDNPRNPSFPGSFGRIAPAKPKQEQQRMEDIREIQKEEEVIDNGNGTTTNRRTEGQETRE